MNSRVLSYYTQITEDKAPSRLFHEVIALHETSELKWEEISKKAKSLPRGWFELSRLNKSDRIEFIREYWLKTLPYLPHVHDFLEIFFSRLDDVGIFITCLNADAPCDSEIVYSLRDGSTFFHGSPPCTPEQIESVQYQFKEGMPEDFLSFLKIHDGFSKHLDKGIIPTKELAKSCEALQSRMLQLSTDVDPSELIPFYDSFGLNSYQCFYASWNPEGGIGNVFYCAMENTISDFHDPNEWLYNLAFPTFLDWLTFYLEGIES